MVIDSFPARDFRIRDIVVECSLSISAEVLRLLVLHQTSNASIRVFPEAPALFPFQRDQTARNKDFFSLALKAGVAPNT
jgi:hypothetical protein